MNKELPILELRCATKNYGSVQSLVNINLRINAGERVALVGASGAGKSTLIGLLNGTLIPSQGEVWVLGHNLTHLRSQSLRQIQHRIGTIYQQFHLVDNLRVVHNVNAGHLGRWSFLKAAFSLIYPLEVETAVKALTQVGIPEKLYARTDTLSGGQQQRVAIARVLVQNPHIILADEPVSSLDPERSREILELLQRLSQDLGKTLVSSLHDFDFACKYYQRIVGLRQGRILFDVAASDVSTAMVKELYRI